MPPRPPSTTALALVRFAALSTGGLSVLLGGLFWVTEPGEQLRNLVVILGGTALSLATLRPAFRPGWRTTAGLVLGGATAMPATYWIRHDEICCEFAWVGSYGYPWRWGARVLHSSTYPENGDALLAGGGGLPLHVDPGGLILDAIFWTYALLLCWLVARAAVLGIRAARRTT
ncbi:MAG: hypothetical protein JWO79_4436 [Actinomycetia bacterium]|nr:hypothetical protein [Actinomycetes bacterium]